MAPLRGYPIQRDPSLNGTVPRAGRLGLLRGLLGKKSGGIEPVGVLVDSMDPVVSGTGSMSYVVRACAVVCRHADTNGPTVSANDSSVTLTTDDVGASLAAPEGNSRIDSIYALQNLVDVDGGSLSANTFVIAVRKGTPLPVPAEPALPAGAVRLANVTITPSTTSTSGLVFTRRHEWVVANGGLVPLLKGSRSFKVWNGTTEVPIIAGVEVAGWTEAQRAEAFVKTGVTAVVLNSGGDGEIVFSTPFPTALGTASIDDVSGSLGAIILKWTSGSSSVTRLTLRGYDSAGNPLASQTIAVSWSAIGR